MTLTPEQIAQIIRTPRAAGEIRTALEMRKWHRLHVTGEGYEHWWMKRNEKLESENSFDLKKYLSRPKTPRLVDSIKKQYVKIFRAQGFVKNYKFTGADKSANLDEILIDVCEGRSLDQFMRDVWFDAMFEEFSGFIEVARKSDEEYGEDNEHPYKLRLHPISCVHDVKIEGKELEYIVLRIQIKVGDKDETAYRVIDDNYDTVYIQDGDGYKVNMVLNENGIMVPDSYPNIFEKVPFIQVSTIKNNIDSEVVKKTVITSVVSHLTTYQSIVDDHIVSVKLHQHPQFYSFPVTCPTCNGTGKEQYYSDDIKYQEGNPVPDTRTCTGCNGAMVVQHWKADTTQGITLPLGEDFEKTGLPAASPPAGYITPDIESMREQRVELAEEERAIEMGALGVEGITSQTRADKTATEVEKDMQPLFDSFSIMSSVAEQIHKFIVDCIGYAEFGDAYAGSYIRYGRKYFIRSESSVTKELEEAHAAGAPDTYIRELMEEQIYVRFEDNPMARNRALMLLDLEPIATKGAVADIPLYAGYTSKKNIVLKINFQDMIDRFEEEHAPVVMYGEGKEYKTKIREIKTILLGYAEEELTQIKEDGPQQNSNAPARQPENGPGNQNN